MPPKRGAKKGAKKGAAPADDVLEEIRHKLERGPLSPQDALRVLGCAQPCPGGVYDRACKGRRDNPNCLHGLVPPEGSYRRKGLWQKDVGAMTSLGPDPNDLKREVRGTILLMPPQGMRQYVFRAVMRAAAQASGGLCGGERCDFELLSMGYAVAELASEPATTARNN